LVAGCILETRVAVVAKVRPREMVDPTLASGARIASGDDPATQYGTPKMNKRTQLSSSLSAESQNKRKPATITGRVAVMARVPYGRIISTVYHS
jgi:hypothetical protein